MMWLRLLLLVLALCQSAVSVRAQLPPGLPIAPENFAATHFFGSPATTNIRHFALGGASVADNRSGWHLNPAGLVALKQPEVLAFASNAGFDALPTFRSQFLGYAQPFGKDGENVAKISLVRVRAQGQVAGGAAPLELNSTEDDLGFEFAHRVSDRLSIGFGTAYLRSKSTYSVAGVGDVTALKSRPSSLGGRVGFIFDLDSRLSIGATTDFYTERVNRTVPAFGLPPDAFQFRSTAYRIGMAFRPDENTSLLADYEAATLSGNNTRLSSNALLLGAERKFGALSLRVGSYDGHLTGGVGFHRGRFSLDYGFSHRAKSNLPGRGARAIHALQVVASF